MSKRNGGTHQSFSLRRIILQRARISESHRTSRLQDPEIGLPKHSNTQIKKETILLKSSPIPDELKVECTTRSGLSAQSCDAETYCIICYIRESPENEFFLLDLCRHKFCISCLIKYLKNEIIESRTDIACPQCSSLIHPNNIEYLLRDTPEFKNKYEDFMIRRYLVSDPDSRWCPAPDCSYAVIATGCASCPQIQCERPNCGMSFCYHCKAEWHPDQTCDAARALRQNVLRTSSISFSQDSTRHDEIKPCPRCQVLIVKMNDGSCNHMICSVCGAEFCWLCMKEVSDLHYLSPSGCTFWGKKPWSRKKKIVWQIGTLIGAPIGIALLAGIAVPSMVIGIPVWVGRKLLDRYKTKTKQKRNISVTIGVTASILISPLLAGLAIAIGVPILLFYVYGVVPVSLCRAGCGASSPNEDYKFEVNISDDNRTQYNSDGGSIDAISRMGDTSLGDFSMSAISGSLVDAVNSNTFRNVQQHNNRASTIALAGSLKNKTIECLDDTSVESTPAIICNIHQQKPSANVDGASSTCITLGAPIQQGHK